MWHHWHQHTPHTPLASHVRQLCTQPCPPLLLSCLQPAREAVVNLKPHIMLDNRPDVAKHTAESPSLTADTCMTDALTQGHKHARHNTTTCSHGHVGSCPTLCMSWTSCASQSIYANCSTPLTRQHTLHHSDGVTTWPQGTASRTTTSSKKLVLSIMANSDEGNSMIQS